MNMNKKGREMAIKIECGAYVRSGAGFFDSSAKAQERIDSAEEALRDTAKRVGFDLKNPRVLDAETTPRNTR